MEENNKLEGGKTAKMSKTTSLLTHIRNRIMTKV